MGGFFVGVFLVLGLIVGYISSALSAGIFADSTQITLWRCIRMGFLTPKGLAITGLLFVIFLIIMLIALMRHGERAVIESTDERGTNYSSTGSLGSMKWMSPSQARREFEVGDVRDLLGFVYGKIQDETDEVVTYSGSKLGDGNKNNLILGQPGTGKSASIIRPELIQALRRRDSFVCTDPKGELFTDTSDYAKNICDILWAINFLNPEYSSGWNILRLVINPKTGRLDDDKLEQFASTYMENAMPDIPDRSDFWYGGALNLLQGTIGLNAYEHEDYIRTAFMEATQTVYDSLGLKKTVPGEIRLDKKFSLVKAEQIFRNAAKDVLSEEEIEETVRNIKSAAPPFSISQVYYDIIKLQNGDYTELEQRISILPHSHPAWACFGVFNGKDVKKEIKASTVQGLGQRMGPLRNEAFRRMLSNDEVDILEINKKQCAVYLIVPDKTKRYKAFTSLFFKFMFNELSTTWNETDALCKEKGIETLSILRPVSVVMDEFANIGTIPEFPEFMSTCRSQKIHITLAVQDIGQLNENYNDHGANTIKNDCDTVIFLGTNDEASAEWLSSFILGVTTIIKQSFSSSMGRLITYGTDQLSESEQQRYLMYTSELRKFKGKVICAQHGKDPLILERFYYKEHPASKWFRYKSLYSTFTPMSERFPEEDPLVIEDLKEIEAAMKNEELALSKVEGRAPVYRQLVIDKKALQIENKSRIIGELKEKILQRVSCFQEDVLDLSKYEAEEPELDLDQYPPEKETVIDGTYKEIESPKKPKKKKQKKQPEVQQEQEPDLYMDNPAETSELND